MLDVPAHPQARVAGRRRHHAWTLTIASLLALALLGVAASAAQAAPTVSRALLTCKTITVTYSGFPNLPGNTIKQKVRIDGVQNAVTKTFVFDGEEGTDQIEINLPLGTHAIDFFAIWRNSNGVSGNSDQFLGKITCENPEPGIVADKEQKFSTNQNYTKELLTLGKVGNVVDYKIVVRNTGNVPLELNFTDSKCDPGTITGGPTAIPRFGSATFFCTHTLTTADREAGIACNTAKVSGKPAEGPEVEAETNTVCVELPDPGANTTFSCEKFVVELNGFPSGISNTVKIRITIDKKVEVEEFVTFIGPSHTVVYIFNLSPGHHSVDSFVIWHTNGFSGNRDQTLKHGLSCP